MQYTLLIPDVNANYSDTGAQELERHFPQLLHLLLNTNTVNGVVYFSSGEKGKSNPELTAKLFECASHLLRY